MNRKKLKKVLVLSLAIMLLVVNFTACSSDPSSKDDGADSTAQSPSAKASPSAQESPADGGAAGEDKLLIGASMATQDNMYWANLGKFVEEAAVNHGYDIVTLWANSDQEKQIKDVEDLVQRGVDILIVGPVQSQGSMAAIDVATAAGIKVVVIARGSDSENVTTGVVFNEAQFGINQGEQILKDFPDGANIIYLYGPVGAGYVEQQYNALLPVLEKNPKMNLLQKYDSPTDTAADGMKNTEDALIRYENIDAIVCPNDDLALGAVRAVEAAGKIGEIYIYGNSGIADGMQAIYEGKMRFTNLKSTTIEAEKVIELCTQVLNNEEVEPMYYLEPVLITEENVLTIKDAQFAGTLEDPQPYQPK